MDRMSLRFVAPVMLVALFVSSIAAAPVHRVVTPAPAATPLKTIKHVYSSRLCTLLRRSIAPAVGRVLQNDHTIARSRPLFQSYARNQAINSPGGTDMDVERLSQLIGPLVKNTGDIERLLNDPAFGRRTKDESEKEVQAMRAQLARILTDQKRALDLVSGFVDTEQMGELQAAGHEYDSSLNKTGTYGRRDSSTPAPTSPTAAPQNILNAGIGTNDVTRKNDPRYTNTGSTLGYNPINAFDQQMENYQLQIAQNESSLTASIFKAIPSCGGHLPGASPASPSPAPVPAPSGMPTASPTPAPTSKP
jgi:hypothetical protein